VEKPDMKGLHVELLSAQMKDAIPAEFFFLRKSGALFSLTRGLSL
jgi:hypothetical protein